MNAKSMLKELEGLGTEQARKTYTRHGVKGVIYGVSYADFGKLVKRIKVDHELALELWKSGVHDARVLATMIGDPALMSLRDLDAWAKDLEDHAIASAFAGFAARTPHARARVETWMNAKSESIAAAGWFVVAQLTRVDEELPDAHFERLLARIEAEIHTSQNRVRYAMNSAVIGIGIRNPALEKKALAAAARIGKVEVDHGDTECKTPDAAAYIAKVGVHRSKRAAKPAAKKKPAKKAPASKKHARA